MSSPSEIVTFWRTGGPRLWFAQDEDFDRKIATLFSDAHHAAARRELDDWAASAEGALALILLTDQFLRNMFRRSAHAYATDPLGRMYAEAAIARGHDQATEPLLRSFFCLPFEHSEDLAHQDRAVEMFTALSDFESLDWAIRHRDAIRLFGRFPGRNAALGRQTTPEEKIWLDSGGGGFSSAEPSDEGLP